MPDLSISVHVSPDDEVRTKVVEGLNGRHHVTVDIRPAGTVGLDATTTLFFDVEDLPVLRRLGVACIEAARDLAAAQRHPVATELLADTDAYTPTGPVADGVEVATGRWACCGGYIVHLAPCSTVGPDDPRDAMAPVELADDDVAAR